MKTALLLSGGYDSVLCYFLLNNLDLDLFFFNYGQSYIEQELKSVKELSLFINKDFIVIDKSWYNDIKNRNFLMISELVSLGYNKIIIGSRNFLPLFDKYKDSNLLTLKLFSFIMRIKIITPLVLYPKWLIKNKLKKYYPLEKLYTTENN